MSLGIYSFRLSVTTKSRRATTTPFIPEGGLPGDWLTAEDGRPLLTQNLNNLTLEQRAVFALLTQSEDAIITQSGALINTLES
jgi:hypothetical protein